MNVIDSIKYYEDRLALDSYTGYAFNKIKLSSNPTIHSTIILTIAVMFQLMYPMYFILPILAILLSHEFVYKDSIKISLLIELVDDELELEGVLLEDDNYIDNEDRWYIFESRIRPLKRHKVSFKKRIKYIIGAILRCVIIYSILYVISSI